MGFLRYTVSGIDSKLNYIQDYEKWFNSVEICMLSDSHVSDKYETARDQCTTPETTDAFIFGALKTFYTGPNSHCCTVEVPLTQRGHVEYFREFESAERQPLQIFFDMLNRANKSFVTIGDSTSSQFLYAMISELKKQPKSSFLEDLTDSVKSELSMLIGDVDKIFGVYRRKNVYLYDIKILDFDMELAKEKRMVEVILPLLLRRHTSGLAIVANIGHHLKKLNKPALRPVLADRMLKFIKWLENLKKDSKNIVIYRETPPSHFDSVDGTYEAWKEPDPNNMRLAMPSDSLFPLYMCREMSPNVTNRPENLLAKQIIVKRNSQIPILEVFKYFRHMYKMHNGNCYFGSDRSETTDCVHICQYVRPMWMPLWTQLHNFAIDSMITTSKIPYDIYFVKAEAVLDDRSTISYYVSCDGIWHLLPDTETRDFFQSKSEHFFGKQQVIPSINTVADLRTNPIGITDGNAIVSEDMLVVEGGLPSYWGPIGVPCFPADDIKDRKVILQSPDSNAAYAVIRGKRAEIPNYETFKKMGGSVSVPVGTLPSCQIELIEKTAFDPVDFGLHLYM